MAELQGSRHQQMEALSSLGDTIRFATGLEHQVTPFRHPRSNPETSIKRMATPARTRYPTDSDVRRIKFHATVGHPGGQSHLHTVWSDAGALIDLAYLTGQRVGDLLDLCWNKRAAADDKGVMIRVTWTPRLKSVVESIEELRRRNLRHVLANQEAQPLLYSTFSTAW